MATKFDPAVNDGAPQEFRPESYKLEYLQSLVAGNIQVVEFRDGSAMMVNECWRLEEQAENPMASVIALLKGHPEDLGGIVVFFSKEEMLDWGDGDMGECA